VATTGTAIEDAEKAGFDLSLMDASLSYSYEKRAIQHQEALNLALELERAGGSSVTDLNRLLQRLCDADIDTRYRCLRGADLPPTLGPQVGS
jgi:hypothetical protein